MTEKETTTAFGPDGFCGHYRYVDVPISDGPAVPVTEDTVIAEPYFYVVGECPICTKEDT